MRAMVDARRSRRPGRRARVAGTRARADGSSGHRACSRCCANAARRSCPAGTGSTVGRAGVAGARRLRSIGCRRAGAAAVSRRALRLIAMHAEERAIEASVRASASVPHGCRELALLAARYCADVRKADKLPVDALLELLQRGRTRCAGRSVSRNCSSVRGSWQTNRRTSRQSRDCAMRWRPRTRSMPGADRQGCSDPGANQGAGRAGAHRAITKAVRSK